MYSFFGEEYRVEVLTKAAEGFAEILGGGSERKHAFVDCTLGRLRAGKGRNQFRGNNQRRRSTLPEPNTERVRMPKSQRRTRDSRKGVGKPVNSRIRRSSNDEGRGQRRKRSIIQRII